ncbi:MAG: hypothetical protein ABSE73_23885 [Planctomycetota bacterium]
MSNMGNNSPILSLLAILLAASGAWASAVDDARKLNDEAQDALRKMSGAATDPKAYAEVVHKLEKAQALLEEAAKSDAKGAESLAQSVSAALFWARRFSTVDVAKEHGKTPAAKAPDAGAGEAEFKKAEDFEKAHAGDDYAVSLRWFQYSDQFSGTNLSLRALARAYEAQGRYRAAEAAKKAAAEGQTEDGKLLLAGNELYQKKDFEAALAKFDQARKINDSVVVERRIGHTWLELGYKLRDEYTVQYLPLLQRYTEAKARGDQKAAAAARDEAQALVTRLRPIEDKALQDYDKAEAAFQRGLELAKGRDLECEAHLGIICFARGKNSQPRAALLLAAVLGKYTPASDEERTIYEFSRTLLAKLIAPAAK